MSAFRGDPAIKAELIAMLDRDAPTPLNPPHDGRAPDLVAWAEEVGLPLALVLLAGRLRFGSFRDDKTPGRFARELLSAIVPGADLAGAPHLWMVWAWDAAPEPLRSLMTSPANIDLAAQAVGLHRRAANGEVTGGEWRAMRARVNVLAGNGDEPARAAAVVAASLWDYRTTPGAVADLVQAWESMRTERVRVAEAWGVAEDARYEEMLAEIRPLLRERVGPRPDRKDADAFSAYVTRFHAVFTALKGEFDSPLWDRNTTVHQKSGRACEILREQGRTALISLVAAGTASQGRDPAHPEGLASNV